MHGKKLLLEKNTWDLLTVNEEPQMPAGEVPQGPRGSGTEG